MVSYKDMTFCSYYQCANFGGKGNKCPRSLTKQVREDARKLKLDIATFVNQPDCFIDPYNFIDFDDEADEIDEIEREG